MKESRQFGNDIVDLDPLALSCWDRPRYRLRSLLTAELALITDLPETPRPEAILFACKESAYKYFVKQGRIRAFHPRSFCVTQLKCQPGHNQILISGQVRCDSGSCRVEGTAVPGQYVHIMAGNLRHEKPGHPFISRASGADQQRVLHEAILKALPEIRDHQPRLSLRKAPETLVPLLFINDQQNNADLTLSHDGRWFAGLITPAS